MEIYETPTGREFYQPNDRVTIKDQGGSQLSRIVRSVSEDLYLGHFMTVRLDKPFFSRGLPDSLSFYFMVWHGDNSPKWHATIGDRRFTVI